MRIAMFVARSNLPLLLVGVVAAALIAPFCDFFFLTRAHAPSRIRYEIVDNRGIVENSLFKSNRNSKVPMKMLAKFIAAPKTPRHTGPCSSVKPSAFSNLFTPFTSFAQECQSPCEGYYNKTCLEHGECEGLTLCCYDVENEDQGCMGVLDNCRNGGTVCGQSECDN
jgi:hypothetical protein